MARVVLRPVHYAYLEETPAAHGLETTGHVSFRGPGMPPCSEQGPPQTWRGDPVMARGSRRFRLEIEATLVMLEAGDNVGLRVRPISSRRACVLFSRGWGLWHGRLLLSADEAPTLPDPLSPQFSDNHQPQRATQGPTDPPLLPPSPIS